jgi:transposase-like protein
MDRQPYASFFLQPSGVWHRRYEALRSVFVEQQPLSEVADRFGVACGTVRNWVSEFCGLRDGGQPPPFSPNRSAGVPQQARERTRPTGRRSRSPTSRPCP